MKIALSKIVGRPLVFANGVSYEFVEALKKLANDPLPIKERYALGRTLEDVAKWVKAFEAERLELIKKHCITRAEFLERRAMALKAEIALAEGGEVKHPGLRGMKESLSRIAQELREEADGQFVPESKAKAEELNQALEAAMGTQAEIFLDHRIALSEESKLSGGEIALLIDLIEPI